MHHRGWIQTFGLAAMAAVLGVVTMPSSSPAAASGDDHGVIIRIEKRVVQDLIRNIVPYTFKVETLLLDEIVTLSNPRAIQLQPGGLSLKMTATGSPIPFVVDVAPQLRIRQDERGNYRVTMDAMPVSVGRLGTIDLATFIEPVAIEQVTSYLFEFPGGQANVETTVRSIRLDADGIDVSLDLGFFR